jgi:hypothetical protein
MYHLSLGLWTKTLSFCLFICLFCFVYLFILFVFVYKILIGYDLDHNCGLRVIDVFNLFEHCIPLEILVFDSCVGLERLNLFD